MRFSSFAMVLALLGLGAHAVSLIKQNQIYLPTDHFDIQNIYDLHHQDSPSGTILMGHKGDPNTLITFAISRSCSAFSTDFSIINKSLGQMLINSHNNCIVCREFQESSSISIGGVEYRTTLKLIVEREMVDVEFAKLVGLLVSTARELFKATGRIAFEVVSLNGEIRGVRFEA
ncbi:hypothetical protein B0J14DRAFT_376251 [Halenospora varia]|nr:hypothetical protein B0J14DRAFT_376251 [Halenospora varia]